MSRAVPLAVSLGALALVVGGVIYAGTLPERAARELRAAIASADGDALGQVVDFDALREDLKHQLLRSFHAAEPDPRLGMIASRYVGALVDGLVTQKTLLGLAAKSIALEHSRARWTGPSSAVVEVAGDDQIVSRWRLERRGLSFVLVGIELPVSMTDELKEQWAARFREHTPSPDEERALGEESKRACSAWRKRALQRLQGLLVAQRAYREEHGRYADDTSLLPPAPVSGPSLYDFVITRADAESFIIEARGKELMAGDVLQAADGGIRVLADACAP